MTALDMTIASLDMIIAAIGIALMLFFTLALFYGLILLMFTPTKPHRTEPKTPSTGMAKAIGTSVALGAITTVPLVGLVAAVSHVQAYHP